MRNGRLVVAGGWNWDAGAGDPKYIYIYICVPVWARGWLVQQLATARQTAGGRRTVTLVLRSEIQGMHMHMHT